jgi:hypothetical protein
MAPATPVSRADDRQMVAARPRLLAGGGTDDVQVRHLLDLDPLEIGPFLQAAALRRMRRVGRSWAVFNSSESYSQVEVEPRPRLGRPEGLWRPRADMAAACPQCPGPGEQVGVSLVRSVGNRARAFGPYLGKQHGHRDRTRGRWLLAALAGPWARFRPAAAAMTQRPLRASPSPSVGEPGALCSAHRLTPDRHF